MNGQTCKECGHSYLSHSHFSVLWQEVEETKTYTNEDFKQRFTEASTEEQRQNVLLSEVERQLADREAEVDAEIAELGRLAEQYAQLALSGSFAEQLHKSVALLEVNLKTMKKDGASLEEITRVEKSLQTLKDKLSELERARTGRRGRRFW